jgi:hypothetical protein
MKVFCFACLVVYLAAGTPAAAQPPDTRLAMAQTLREALSRSGFDDAIDSADGPDLDRTLTSSGFSSTADAFVAAYYFQDENLGVALSRDSDGRYTSEALDGVVQAILHRP